MYVRLHQTYLVCPDNLVLSAYGWAWLEVLLRLIRICMNVFYMYGIRGSRSTHCVGVQGGGMP